MVTRHAFDRWWPFAVSFAVTCIFFIDVCGWMFDCGCRSLWAGAAEACNIHGPGRHCPFCTRGVIGYGAILALVCAPQLAASLQTQWGRVTRGLVCLVLFPASMMVVGAALGWYDGYWR